MPCSDSSSSISLKLDKEERFVSFEFAKITCGREITAQTGYSKYLLGRSLDEIIKIPYAQAMTDLGLKQEEEQFVLYLEWDALRAAIVQYLGVENNDIDLNRCRITSLEYSPEGIEIAEVILPPKELPKILPCSLANN